jgi:hypothetical protein
LKCRRNIFDIKLYVALYNVAVFILSNLKNTLFDICLNTSLHACPCLITVSQSHTLRYYNVLGTELRYTAVNKSVPILHANKTGKGQSREIL